MTRPSFVSRDEVGGARLRIGAHNMQLNNSSREEFTMQESFRRFAHKTSQIVGSSWAFITAVVVLIVWAVSGPIFGFSNTWQLIINTGTTIVTFLMVFLIQNTQNRDAQAIHLKLDELLRAVSDARNNMIDLEDLSDDKLQQLQQEFERLRRNGQDSHPAHN
jgi:low affinity Fe/Cu permease